MDVTILVVLVAVVVVIFVTVLATARRGGAPDDPQQTGRAEGQPDTQLRDRPAGPGAEPDTGPGSSELDAGEQGDRAAREQRGPG